MNKVIIIALSVAMLAVACNRVGQDYNDGTVSLASAKVNVEVVQTLLKRTKGLGGRVVLSESQGMWFVFDTDERHIIWMKDMQFSIDIVWVRDGRVVDIAKNVQPQIGAADSELKLYEPVAAADSVLELRGGWAERHGLNIGDLVEFSPR